MPCVGTYRITVDDASSIEPVNAMIYRYGGPLNLASYTLKATLETPDGTVELAATATGVTAHPTQTFTAEADDDYLTCRAHGVKEGDQIVVANSGGALPTGLSASTPYFAVNVTPNKFQLATLPGGAKIDLTTDGTGTNTFYVVGSVQFAPAAANVDTPGVYRLWFQATSGSDVFHYPIGQDYFEVRIEARGN
jgi:hypothetical protein